MTYKLVQYSFLGTVAALLLFWSCDNNVVYEKNIAIPGQTWKADFQPAFEFQIEDTTAFYNFYVNIRNNTDYPYRNLYLFVHSFLPGNLTATDTIEVYLADREGKWLGKGLGKIKESRFFLKQHLIFPRKGRYTIQLEQAMRRENLPGIEDIGIRIEKAQ